MLKYIQIILVVLPFWGISQTEVVYVVDKNKVAEFAKEVFFDCDQYAQEVYFEDYQYMIEQVEILILDDQEKLNQFPLLSTIMLKNKCNKTMEYDTESKFSKDTFNPLKYFFPFYTENTKLYHVDGTNYVIRIKGN